MNDSIKAGIYYQSPLALESMMERCLVVTVVIGVINAPSKS